MHRRWTILPQNCPDSETAGRVALYAVTLLRSGTGPIHGQDDGLLAAASTAGLRAAELQDAADVIERGSEGNGRGLSGLGADARDAERALRDKCGDDGGQFGHARFAVRAGAGVALTRLATPAP